MNVKIEESWMNVLGGEFSKPYFTALAQFVRNEYAAGLPADDAELLQRAAARAAGV